MNKTHAANIVIEKKPAESAVEVRAEIPADAFPRYRAKALKELNDEVSLDGFRKGNIPEAILVQKLGEAAIMERVAGVAVSEELPLILAAEKIVAIETPRVTITKLAPNNPIAFTALVTVMPDIALPDYVALAKKHAASFEMPSVSDDELADMTRFLKRERARIDRIEIGMEPETAYEETQKLEEKDLPMLDDAFAQSLGAADAADLATRMRENMQKDKERKAREKTRMQIIEAILEKTPMKLPNILIEHELDRMLERMAHDIEHSGSTLEAYLKQSGKQLDELRKEWRESAEKRARVQIIVHEIAAKENITPEEEAIVHELEHLKSHHPDVSEQNLRMHIISSLLPDAVFKWLEGQQ